MSPTSAEDLLRSDRRPARTARLRALAGAFVAALLVACGGGGGGGGGTPAPSGPAYPLRDAMVATLKAGATYGFRVTGPCQGTAEQVDSPAMSRRSDGADRWVVTSTLTVRVTNCPVPTFTSTQTTTYDASFVPLGVSAPAERWEGRFEPPTPYPAEIRVGDSGSLGSLRYFATGAPSVTLGRDDITWTVEPDTDESVVFKRTTRSYDADGALELTEEDRFRIGRTGGAQLLTVRLIDGTGSGLDFVMTAGADVRPPEVASVAPAKDTTGVPLGTTVTVGFSEPIDTTSVGAGTLTVTGGPTPVTGTVQASGSTVTFVPAAALQPQTRYVATLSPGVRDLAGNPTTQGTSWSFTTGRVQDLTPPTISSVRPAEGAIGVPRASAVTVTLSEPADPASVTPSALVVSAGGVPLAGTVSASGNDVVFRPAAPLPGGTVLTATLGTGIRDASGNALAAGRTWTFATGAASPEPPLSRSVTVRGDYAHTGFATFGGAALAFPATHAWSVTLPGAASYPVIADGRVFVTASDTVAGSGTQLHALDAATGTTLWGPVSIPGPYYLSGLAYDQGSVFVLSGGGFLRAFDASTGAQRWGVQMPAQWVFGAPPVAIDGTVYVHGHGSGGALYAVDGSNGSMRWRTDLAGGGNGAPAVVGNAVYVSYPCFVHRVDAGSGAIAWTWSGGCIGGGGKTPVVANGSVYTRDTASGSGVVLDAATGTQTGTFAGGASTGAPAVTSSAEYLVANGAMRSYDPATRVVRWTFTGDGTLASEPIVIDGTVVVGSASGTVYAVDAATGATRWTGVAGAPVPPPDEQNYSQPRTGLGAGEGWLVVPAGNVLRAWRLSP